MTTHLRAMRLLLLALLLAGCNRPAEGPLLHATRIEGGIALGDAFLLEKARLSVAPADAPARGTQESPVPLADPPPLARSGTTQDHWVLEARVREREAGSARGPHVVRLDWNGALAGEIHITGGDESPEQARGVVLRFDLGDEIPRSNVYAFELTRRS